jgi:hypothetical protein
MTDPNAPQNVPSEQPTSVPPSEPPAFIADGQQQQQQQPRYGEMHPDPVQQSWDQTGQQTPAPQQGGQWGQPQTGEQAGQWGQPQQGQYGQPQHTGQYGQDTGQYGQQPQHTGQYGAPQGQYGQPQQGQYGQPQQYAQAPQKAPNPRARETRLALVSVGIAAGIAAAVALVSLIGSFFNLSEYYSIGDVLLNFGANLVNIALWGAGAALILIMVRPLTRVRTARDLIQSVGIAAAVGTGVMLLIVLIVTIVRGVVEQYGTPAFFVNQGFLSPILYGVTLAGFLTIGVVLTTRFVAPEGLADASQGQHGSQQHGQQFLQGQHEQQGGQHQTGQHDQGSQQHGQAPQQYGQPSQQHNPYQQ